MKSSVSHAPRKSSRSPLPERRLLSGRWQRDLLWSIVCGGLLAGLLYERALRPAAPAVTAPVEAPVPAERTRARSDESLPPGPWGDLRATQVWLSPPAGAVKAEDCASQLHPWHFVGLSRAQTSALLESAQLDGAQRGALLATAQCDASGCTLTPTAAQREGLPQAARRTLYLELARHKANPMQLYSTRFLPTMVEPWLAAVALPAGLARRVRNVLFPFGGAVAFADQDTLCVTLPAPERAALVRALTTVPAELLSVHVAPGARIDDLVAYWGQGVREDQVRPVLAALAQRPQGGDSDVSHLLPPFPAAHLYHYPAASDPNYSCHHGALNFFADVPDSRYLSDAEVAKALMERYQQVPGPPRLGDVLTLQRPDGSVLHSMVYVGGDVVFTKNGLSHHAPWILAHQRNVRALYDGEQVEEHLYRKK